MTKEGMLAVRQAYLPAVRYSAKLGMQETHFGVNFWAANVCVTSAIGIWWMQVLEKL
jgi:hypothetical protein